MGSDSLRNKHNLSDDTLRGWARSETPRFVEAARLIELLEKPPIIGGERPSLDEYMTDLLPRLARRGTCPRRKVAAIVTDEHGTLLGTGYNGVPRGVPHCIDHPCPGALDKTGDNSRCEAIHGEMNALLQSGSRLAEATSMYVTSSPCFNCAKLIICSNIQEIVCLELYAGDLSGVDYLVNHGRKVYLWRNNRRHPILEGGVVTEI